MAWRWPDGNNVAHWLDLRDVNSANCPIKCNEAYTVKAIFRPVSTLDSGDSAILWHFWDNSNWDVDGIYWWYGYWQARTKGTNTIDINSYIKTGKWNVVVFSRTATAARVHINGQYAGACTPASFLAGDIYEMWICKIDYQTNINSDLGGITIWQRALSDVEARLESQSRYFLPIVSGAKYSVNFNKKDTMTVGVNVVPDLAVRRGSYTPTLYWVNGTNAPVWVDAAPFSHHPANQDGLPDAAQFARPVADIRTGNWKAV